MCSQRIRQRAASLAPPLLAQVPCEFASADPDAYAAVQFPRVCALLIRVFPRLLWGGVLALGIPSVNPAFAIAAVTIPPPCNEAFFDSQSIDALAADVRDSTSAAGYWAAGCASEALSRKGEEAIPALIPLMESHEPNAESLAITAVCGKGHRGEPALPYILDRIRRFDYAFARSAYPVLACMQDAARPAIPLLIARSLQTIPVVPAEDGDAAIETLGRLAALDPDTIIPHLVKLLELPIHTGAAAKALEQIGDPARGSASALRIRLDSAIKDRQDTQEVAPLIAALTRLGNAADNVELFGPLLDGPYGSYAAKALGEIGREATPAVPLLIRALDSARIKPENRHSYVAALTSIDPESARVHRALLREATSEGGGRMEAASSLSEIEPLPAEFAPVLARKIESLDEHDAVRDLLIQALQHTHTDINLGPSAPSHPPIAAPSYLARAIESLAKQPHAVTLRDAMIALRLSPRDYEQNHSFVVLAPPSVAGTRKVIASVNVAEVRPGSGYPPSMVPGLTQDIRVSFSKGYCLPSESISDYPHYRPPKHDRLTIEVLGHRVGPPAFHRFRGHLPNDKFAATESRVFLDSDCGSNVEILKSFAPDYWRLKCPFVYGPALVSDRLIPALRHQIGPDFERYDLDAPKVEEWGPDVRLAFAAPTDSSDSAPKSSLRLGVWVDRCSRLIRSASEY
jgi:hypothetical protein